jgi:hypothetical protein
MNHLLEIASKHKKVTAGVIVAILAVGGAGFASMASHPATQTNHNVEAHASNNHKEALAKVAQLRKVMEAEKDDQKKLNDLKQIEVKYQKYKKEPTSYRKLTNAYQGAIHSGKAYFINKTNKNIQNLTVKDINKENDKDSLNKKIKSLQDQLKFVKDNQEAIFTENNVKNYGKQISGLVKKYQDRVKALDEQKKNEDAKDSESKAAEQSSQVSQSSQQNQENAQNQGNSNGQSSSVGNQGNSGVASNGGNSYRGNGNSGNSYSGRNNSSYNGNSGNSYSKSSQPSRPSTPSRPANNGNSGNGNVFHGSDANGNGKYDAYNDVNGNTTVHFNGEIGSY